MFSRIMLHEGLSDESKSMPVFRSMANGSLVDGESIRALAHNFHGGGPLAFEALPLFVLRDLCKIMEIHVRIESYILPTTWQRVRCRFALQQALARREEDDRSLAQQDLSTLTKRELERENERRKMRWLGPEEALRSQLETWLSLSLDPKIPNHLLLFLKPCATESDAMMSHLSQEERDHILGLDKFDDSPLKQWLRASTERSLKQEKERKANADAKAKAKAEAKAKEQDAKSIAAMEEKGVEVKAQAEVKVAAELEAKAIDEAKVEEAEESKEEVEKELDINAFSKLEKQLDLDDLREHIEQVNVEVRQLREQLLTMEKALQAATDDELLATYDGLPSIEGSVNNAAVAQALLLLLKTDACTAEQIQLALGDFDLENPGSVSRSEFKNFVSRCRAET